MPPLTRREFVRKTALVSTNGAAQWGLAAIERLALIGDAQPQT